MSFESVPKIKSVEIENTRKDRKEILYDGYYYDITNFIKKHPGGSIIEFYTDYKEDATIPFQQFHYRSSKKVHAMLGSFKRRPAEDQLNNILDEKVRKKNEILTADFIKLYREFEKEGIFKPSIPHVIYRVSEVLILFFLGMYFISWPPFAPIISRGLAIFFCIAFISRAGWAMHEGGHHSLTGYPPLDRFIQTIFYCVGFGLSSTWWQRNHNMHHAMPQRFHRDHDLDTLPIFAFHKKIAENTNMGKNFFIQHQADLFLPISNFLGVLSWKIYLHPLYTLKKKEYFVFFLMLFTNLFMLTKLGVFSYLFVMWATTNYYFGNFSLSHTHLEVTEEPTHWVEYAFTHTMDIEPSPLVNYWMGYLNFQIEHHLFPTMPQFRGPLIRERVKAFAEKHGLPYHCKPYFEACRMTYNNMKRVSKELKID